MRLVRTIVCVMALLAAWSVAAATSALEASVGEAAPAFELVDPAGEPVRLADLRGKVVVVNFWASWCSPCMAELPLLDALHGRLQADGATVLAVNVDTARGPAMGAVRKLELTLPVALDPKHAAVAQYSPERLPATFVIDGAGVVRSIRTSEIEEADVPALEAEVRGLLGVTP